MKSKMSTITLAGAATIAVALGATTAFADSKTVIRENDGKYTETRKGDDEQYKYQTDGVKSSETYKGDDVQMKTQSNGIKTKQVYKDGDCKVNSSENLAAGKSKTVTEGDCAP